jgi:predicted nucleic acid-binding protein
MGIIDSPQGQKLYLDTNIWIYALEGYPEYRQNLHLLFSAIDQGRLGAVTSELTLAEVLVKPVKNQQEAIRRAYETAIRPSASLQVIGISRDILIQSACLRAQSKLKLPDAIHAATALALQCDIFLTNDQGFQSVPQLPAIDLSDFFGAS